MAAPMPMIIGVPRSGTTLLRLILDAHPLLAIPPETGFLREVVGLDRQDQDARSLLQIITRCSEWPDFNLDGEELRRVVASLAPFSPTEGVRAFYRLYAQRCGKPRWGDKTPGYVTLLPELQQ